MPVDDVDPPAPSPYLKLLRQIHRHVEPRTYVEIGVSTGRSLALALPGTVSIGIDPAPKVQGALGPHARVVQTTSDEFFARPDAADVLGGAPLDLAFIDGMHQFEYALRDFMHLERWAGAESTILVHDCYPVDEVSAARERTTDCWSGDIWKLIVCLKQWRPDLKLAVIDVAPTGLGLIRGLDPRSSVLEDHYDEILEAYVPMAFSHLEEAGKAEALNRVPNDWLRISALLAPGAAKRKDWLEARARPRRRALRPALARRVFRAGNSSSA